MIIGCARSGEYGGWGRTYQPSFKFLSCVTLAVWGLALSWRRTTFFQLTSAGRFSSKLWWTCCSCWIYKSAVTVSLRFNSLKWIIPRRSHHTHNIIFLPWSSAFGSVCGDFTLSTCLLSATLSYVIHFSSPVMILSKNGSFLCRERRLVAIDKRSALFFSLRACGI